MLKTLVKKEILNNLLNLRFSLSYFLCTALIVGSMTIMLADFVADKKIHETDTTIYTRRTNEITHPRHYLWSTKGVSRKPALTRAFVIGGEKDADSRAEPAPEFSPYFHGDFKRNPLTNLFPTIDMAFIIGVIVSLLIFVLTYDSVSGEREENTLKVLLACPIPRDQIILAKWLGGFISLIIPFVTSWIICGLLLVFVPGLSVSADAWSRIIMLFFLSGLYIAVIFSLSMMISSIVKHSTTGILSLLLLWVVGIVLIPSLSTPAAYLIVNPKGVNLRHIAMRHWGVVDWNNFDENRDTYLKTKFGDREPDQLSTEERREYEDIRRKWFWYDVEYKMNGILKEGRRMTREEEQIDRISRRLARISPYGCFQNACVNIAGTGFQREKALRKSVEDYGMNAFNFVREHENSDTRKEFRGEDGPQYSWGAPSFSAGLAASLFDIGILGLMGVTFFLLGYIGFVRMEII